MINSNVSISLVSHGHGDMVWKLVDQLVICPEVSEIIVTLNIPEISPAIFHNKVVLVKNDVPKGFGANHNAAFALAKSEFFCVINPDIELIDNPFDELVKSFSDEKIGLVAPIVVGGSGLQEDSMRRFLTPLTMLNRVLGFDSNAYDLRQVGSYFTPDWVAGMFMLFRRESYSNVAGFDVSYFMYCEDADICTRLWRAGYKIVGCMSVTVIHNAQRASRRSFKHLSWHIRSIIRYFYNHSFSLPNKDEVKKCS